VRMRSTGLGQTELVGSLTGIEKKDGALIAHVHTTEPVQWHAQVALTIEDVAMIARAVLRPQVLRFVVVGVLRNLFHRERRGDELRDG